MELTVAEVGAAHALKGEVLLNLHTDVPEERIYPGAQFNTVPANRGPLTVETIRVHKGRLAVRFAGHADRNAAEALRGTKLVITVAEEDLEEDAWYAHELIGLKVQHVNGTDLGEVSDLLLGDAQDLLEVKYQGRKILVPFVEEIVPEIDEETGVVLVDPPGGLFDDNFETTAETAPETAAETAQ